MTDAEIYEVIDGFKNGKKLEMYSCATDVWMPTYFFNLTALMHGMITGNIFVRIKPEPKYRPFETVEEVEPYYGKIVQYDNGTSLLTGAFIDFNGKLFLEIGTECKIPQLDFKFKDGTPFGVEVKE